MASTYFNRTEFNRSLTEPMAQESERNPSKETEPMPLYKAFGWLLPLYLLIGGYAVWQLRRLCLLERDSCGFSELLESAMSSWLTLIGSILILAVLLQITWHIISRARAGTLGVQEDEPEPRFNGSGLLVSIIIFALYLGIALAVIVSANGGHDILDEAAANLFFWKLNGPLLGSTIVFAIVWHVNDLFSKPAPGFVLLLLFFAMFGAIYWAIGSLVLDVGV